MNHLKLGFGPHANPPAKQPLRCTSSVPVPVRPYSLRHASVRSVGCDTPKPPPQADDTCNHAVAFCKKRFLQASSWHRCWFPIHDTKHQPYKQPRLNRPKTWPFESVAIATATNEASLSNQHSVQRSLWFLANWVSGAWYLFETPNALELERQRLVAEACECTGRAASGARAPCADR